MDGWNWLWMTFGMAFWLVVYVAVRLATRGPRARHP